MPGLDPGPRLFKYLGSEPIHGSSVTQIKQQSQDTCPFASQSLLPVPAGGLSAGYKVCCVWLMFFCVCQLPTVVLQPGAQEFLSSEAGGECAPTVHPSWMEYGNRPHLYLLFTQAGAGGGSHKGADHEH